MADPAADAPSPPGEWPVHPDLRLILNRMGSFDWDLDTGLMHMDEVALAVFEMDPAEYDGRPETLERRFPPGEAERLDAMVAQALKDGSTHYGTYFRVRTRDGGRRWTHTQGFIRRDEHGRPRRVIGIVRDATPNWPSPPTGGRSTPSAAGRPVWWRPPPPPSPTPAPSGTSSTC